MGLIWPTRKVPRYDCSMHSIRTSYFINMTHTVLLKPSYNFHIYFPIYLFVVQITTQVLEEISSCKNDTKAGKTKVPELSAAYLQNIMIK